MALMVVFALVIPVQVLGQGDCDPNGSYPSNAPGEGEGCGNYDDCNNNGAYDVGEPCHEGNGDQHEGQQEGQHEGPQAGDECHQCDHVYSGPQDRHGHCDQCDHVYDGEEDHHGHCRECEAVMDDQSDWDSHCQDNPEHCRPQAGDECHECDYVFTGNEGESHGHCHKCDHVYNSEEDHHGHCDYEGCDAVMNSDADWDEHCRNNEGHCPGGGGDDGPARFDDVNTSDDDCINLDEAYAFFGQGEDRDEFANGNDEEPGFNDIASRKENDECGNDQASRKEFYMATYEWMNGMNEEEGMGMGQATMANCSAWCAGIPEYKTKDENGEWSSAMARYADEDCPCHEGNH